MYCCSKYQRCLHYQFLPFDAKYCFYLGKASSVDLFFHEFDRVEKCVLVNEEGRLKGLPTNPFFARYYIVGDVVLMNMADFLDEGEEE